MHSKTPPLEPRPRSQPEQQSQQLYSGQTFRPPIFPTPANSEETIVPSSADRLDKSREEQVFDFAKSVLQSTLNSTTERSLSLSAPTTPCISRRPTSHDIIGQDRIPGHQQTALSPFQQQQQQQPQPQQHPNLENSQFGGHKAVHHMLAAPHAAGIQSLPSSTTDASFSRRSLRFRHQRTQSVQGAVTPQSLTTSGGFTTDSGPRSAIDSSDRAWRRSRRGSMAVSANLSITQGLPVDLDRIDMDDEDEDDGDDDEDNVAGSGPSSCGDGDGDIDDDSMALDDNNNDSLLEYPSSYGWRASECDLDSGERIRPLPASRANSLEAIQPPNSRRRQSMNVPRNKAFLRLLSLVEEDRQPLASEMEHEGQITRSIRHTNVQEWLRSASAHLNQPAMHATPPLEDSVASSAPVTATQCMGSPLRNPTRAATGSAFDYYGATTALPREIIFPASPSSSAVSSPKIGASGIPQASVSTMSPSGLSISTTAVRSAKRKPSEDSSASPVDQSQTQNTPSRLHPYKRQAMSPSGLRSQIPIGSSRRKILLPSTRSNPSSPQLMSRPVAMPITSHQLQPTPSGQSSSSAGTCPVGQIGGTAGLLGSRARSRSGAGLGYGTNGAGLSILQANGVFSRMNINDKMDDSP
ncbi:hypothetical protein GGI15_001458 [Coemansia interrupta]|uniref:Uncharacterized protein n=1 Tax=Coemansia interrupta TaxID=1126814 RepID=A0A9W8HP94_9FUNG|nr:hypothetical protein GGI15_001458 [Coemansia interrupta]